jgi:1-acyl-sn-glycerol-3-phosphate acyltransferase
LRTLFSLYAWLVWGLVLLLGGPIAVVATLISAPLGFRVVRFGARLALGLTGIRVQVVGRERVDWSRAHVVMGNHTSYLDPFFLVLAVPRHMVGIEKKENLKVPVYGQLAAAWGNLPIDRANPEAARATIAEAEAKLASGTSIVIFPEGTRSETGDLGPFKKGGFHLALNTGADIVPMTFSGAYERLRPRGWHVEPGTVTVEFGEAIPTTNFDKETMEPLMARVREAIATPFLGLEAAK